VCVCSVETDLEHSGVTAGKPDDLAPAAGDDPEPKKPSAQILKHELKEALDALERSSAQLFFSGVAAGMEIGFSLFLMAIVETTAEGELPHAVVKLLVANMYSFGFILVILGRSELFTEQTSLAVMPVLNGQASLADLARVWGCVYSGNVLGAAIMAAVLAWFGPALGEFSRETLVHIASRAATPPGYVMLMSGVLAGWLMGLLSWLVAASRDTISQVAIIWLVATAIGLGHLHHAVLGSVEVLAGVFASRELTAGDFGRFLLWTTLGNALGGPIFVALLKYTHARRPEHEPT
jgi:formate/nitrite transporter FocA (FNT family)